jgi:predicted metal-dependent hydrolase
MAQKTVFVPSVGEVILSKRRGTTHLRISINAAGKVRVGLPSWTPYATGIAFVKSKSDWISKQLAQHVQAKTMAAAERALKAEAIKLLPQRLKLLALKNGFNYKDVRVRKLTARWGSCSSTKVITLSYYLIQLPWPLIDYVLLHELTHTQHMHHGSRFWDRFKQVLPTARMLQKEIRSYRPIVKPYKAL